MKLTGNTILVTGGGSGIGRGLAEGFHKLGNKVIVAGRRKANLSDVIQENPGMDSVELDVRDPESIASVTKTLIRKYPQLNVLLNNAGLMLVDDVSKPIDENILTSQYETNVYGTIRMTSALIEHFKAQPYAVVLNNSSIQAFSPLAFTGLYSTTKAALHAYSMVLRYMLKGTSVHVQELAPPWVGTDLLDSSKDPRSMPLPQFVEQTMEKLSTDDHEVLVEAAKPFRGSWGAEEDATFNQMNDWFKTEVFKLG
jgi:uncharacterized oxidoreductase